MCCEFLCTSVIMFLLSNYLTLKGFGGLTHLNILLSCIWNCTFLSKRKNEKQSTCMFYLMVFDLFFLTFISCCGNYWGSSNYFCLIGTFHKDFYWILSLHIYILLTANLSFLYKSYLSLTASVHDKWRKIRPVLHLKHICNPYIWKIMINSKLLFVKMKICFWICNWNVGHCFRPRVRGVFYVALSIHYYRHYKVIECCLRFCYDEYLSSAKLSNMSKCWL